MVFGVEGLGFKVSGLGFRMVLGVSSFKFQV